ADDDETLEARPPRLTDLISLCRHLNAEGARYVVIGGMATIRAGFPRATGDIDLLIEVDFENQERVRRALMTDSFRPTRAPVPDEGHVREKDKLDRSFLSELLARKRR
ncbi:MAG: hypothetical protein ACREQY_17395, partial [Candidatus Binatia bacterium]